MNISIVCPGDPVRVLVNDGNPRQRRRGDPPRREIVGALVRANPRTLWVLLPGGRIVCRRWRRDAPGREGA